MKQATCDITEHHGVDIVHYPIISPCGVFGTAIAEFGVESRPISFDHMTGFKVSMIVTGFNGSTSNVRFCPTHLLVLDICRLKRYDRDKSWSMSRKPW